MTQETTPQPLPRRQQSRTMLDRARDVLGARMTKDNLRLVLENVVTYATSLQSRVTELETLVVQQQAYGDQAFERYIRDLGAHQLAGAMQYDRITELEKREALVVEFVAKRAEYIVAIENCHPDNARDYYRWQGHAESRRQLAEALGLPVAWPTPAEAGDGS